jgi:hypothetical protein
VGDGSAPVAACKLSSEGSHAAGRHFEGLLAALLREHERELEILREEIAQLRRQQQAQRLPRAAFLASSTTPASEVTPQREDPVCVDSLPGSKDAAVPESEPTAHLGPAPEADTHRQSRGDSVASPAQAQGLSSDSVASYPLAPDSPRGSTTSTGLDVDATHFAAAGNSVVRRHLLMLRDEWNKDGKSSLGIMDDRVAVALSARAAFLARTSERPLTTFCNPFPTIDPDNKWRLYWDVAGVTFIVYDMICIPLQVFDLSVEMNDCIHIIDFGVILFWTADMIQSFVLGYYKGDELETRPMHTILHYLRTWFSLDCLTVVPDWVIVFSGSQQVTGQSMRLLRGAKFLKVLRLMRVMKLARCVNRLYDLIEDEYTFVLAEMVKILLFIVAFNHVIACAWFAVGMVTCGAGMPNWITWTEDFESRDTGYQYTTSLHWSLTQFTPASMDVVPRNMFERLFCICVVLFGMLAFSSTISTVTASMTFLRSATSGKLKNFWLLRRYLSQMKISKDLSRRMTRYLEYRVSMQDRQVQVAKVSILGQLSDTLKGELAHELHAPCLRSHKFFKHLSEEFDMVSYNICQSSLRANPLATGDLAFSAGEEGTRAFIVKDGHFEYTFGRTGGVLRPPLENNEWIAEAVLWTRWRYRGACVASVPSELLSLEATAFMRVVAAHNLPGKFAYSYGLAFVEYLNAQHPADWTDVLRDEGFYEDAVTRGRRYMSQSTRVGM